MASPIDIPEGIDLTGFPYNVSVVIARAVATEIPEAKQIVLRDLTFSDPNFSVGVDVIEWAPNGYEIGRNFPTMSAYRYSISTLVRAVPDVAALAENARLSKKLMVMLYRDGGVSVTLSQLQSTMFDVGERVHRMTVEKQEFRSGRREDNSFVVVSTTQLKIDTENY